MWALMETSNKFVLLMLLENRKGRAIFFRTHYSFKMSGGFTSDEMKVVIINTQYVETDAMSFRSVVQRFTGKDSKIELEKPGLKEKPMRFQSGVQMLSPTGNPVMCRGMSFKDLDRLITEMPPLEELWRLYAEV